MIGDSMTHDILGASLVDIDTCLVKTGLHSGVFEGTENPVEVNKSLTILAAQYNNIRPKFLVDSLKWGKALPDRKHRKRTV